MKLYHHIFYNIITTMLLFVMGLQTTFSQDIEFTLENPVQTKDANGYYYEIDVMIKMLPCPVCKSSGFKLGSGQLYFNYNTKAFGENVSNNQHITIVYDNGYILSQEVPFFTTFIDVYNPPNHRDNNSSRLSVFFDQSLSAGTIPVNNVTIDSAKLFRLKLKYVDTTKDANISFEGTTSFDDQFYKACGPYTSGFSFADCTNYPGELMVNDYFSDCINCRSLNYTNSSVDKEIIVYPNPTNSSLVIKNEKNQEMNLVIRNFSGQTIREFIISKGQKEFLLDVSSYKRGIYFIDGQNAKGIILKQKFIKQ